MFASKQEARVDGPKSLTADDLLGDGSREIREVEIERLGGSVYLIEMTAEQVIHFEAGDRDATVKAVLESVVTKDGKPMFDGKDMEDVKHRLGFRTYRRLQSEVLALNGMEAAESFEPGAIAEAMATAGIADDRAATVLRLLGVEEGNA